MRRPALFRAIYAELRNSLGNDVASRELVRLADFILRACLDGELDDESDEPRASRSLTTLPVDEAMGDGGWKVLEFETKGKDIDELPA